jgi:ArsR family transcriptional regulator
MQARRSVQFTPADTALDPLRARVARLMQALAEPARLRIIAVLAVEEAPVGAVASAARLTPAAASRQLKQLFEAGLLARRREGTQVLYRLADARVTTLCRLAAELLPPATAATGASAARVFNGPARPSGPRRP